MRVADRAYRAAVAQRVMQHLIDRLRAGEYVHSDAVHEVLVLAHGVGALREAARCIQKAIEEGAR